MVRPLQREQGMRMGPEAFWLEEDSRPVALWPYGMCAAGGDVDDELLPGAGGGSALAAGEGDVAGAGGALRMLLVNLFVLCQRR